MTHCNNCGSEALFNDSTNGQIICTSCGSLHTENVTVSTLNFQEDNGISSLTGQMIKLGSTQTFHKQNFFQSSNTDRILSLLESLCVPLTLPLSYATHALRWYKLSLQYNLTKGKSIILSLSACLYIVCRIEHTPHMIIDFSAALRVDCAKIGKVYLQMVKLLNVKVPLVDPSLYVHRYVGQLGLSNNAIVLANRIIGWMKRDWIVTGRRPNNVCGAALLLASRIINEERSVEEVARIVRGGMSTILKRMKEISETETAGMTVDEFMRIWLEKEEDPPIKKYNEKMKSKKREIEENYNQLEKIRMKEIEEGMKKLSLNKKMREIELQNINYEAKKNVNSSIVYSVENEIEEEYDFDNDSEIENCLLSENESKKKEEVWNEMFDEFMKEKENKVALKKPVKRKTQNKKEVKVEKVEKRKTEKLNYEMLDNFL